MPNAHPLITPTKFWVVVHCVSVHPDHYVQGSRFVVLCYDPAIVDFTHIFQS